MRTRENNKMGSRSGLITLMFILIGWTLSTNAQEAACSNAEQGTSYYFVNGILTDFVGGVLSTQHLSRELDAEGILGPSDRVSLAYNDTGFPIPILNLPPGTPQQWEDGLYDLIEALALDIRTNIGPGLNELGETAVELAVRAVLSRATVVDLPFLDEQALEDQVIEVISRLVRDLIGDDQVDAHVARYRSDILAGEKVVLVAHSQGNYFANVAYGLLSSEEQASLGIVSVSNPDGQVALNQCTEEEPGTLGAIEMNQCSFSGQPTVWLTCNNGVPNYTTVCRDRIINGLRTNFGWIVSPLPPNFFGPGGLEEEDFFWHGFQEVYLRSNSPTRTRILNMTRDTAAGLLTPVIGGDLTIHGAVLSDENLSIGGARVKVELIADALGGSSGLYDAVVDDYTNEAGAYSLCIPSNAVPANILVSASADRFIPQIQSVPNPGPGELEINFRLGNLGANTVVIEVDPIIHHLGDDNAGGAINSQFQKLSEGLVYETSFFLSEEQRSIQAATLQLYARGLQAENPLTINGEIVTFLNTSPADGSLGSIEVQVPISALDLESGVQILRIESEIGGVLFSDRDDFEFVNIIVSLTL